MTNELPMVRPGYVLYRVPYDADWDKGIVERVGLGVDGVRPGDTIHVVFSHKNSVTRVGHAPYAGQEHNLILVRAADIGAVYFADKDKK
jgi:hypothetical protein